MKTKLQTLLWLAALGSISLLGADRYFQPEERIPSVTTYSLNMEETKEAAILWLHHKRLYPTNGLIEVQVNCGGLLGKDGKPMQGIIIKLKGN